MENCRGTSPIMPPQLLMVSGMEVNKATKFSHAIRAANLGKWILLIFWLIALVVEPAIAWSKSNSPTQQETASQRILYKVIEDIRHCDKTVRYMYDDETGLINPPELRNIKGLRLNKLHHELAVFQIDEMYVGMHATTLLVGRSRSTYIWPIHAVAFDGSFNSVRQRLELLWGTRFKKMLRPGPDVIYSGKYAQVELLVDGKRRFLAVEKMPEDIYPFISQPDVGCNHVEN